MKILDLKDTQAISVMKLFILQCATDGELDDSETRIIDAFLNSLDLDVVNVLDGEGVEGIAKNLPLDDKDLMKDIIFSMIQLAEYDGEVNLEELVVPLLLAKLADLNEEELIKVYQEKEGKILTSFVKLIIIGLSIEMLMADGELGDKELEFTNNLVEKFGCKFRDVILTEEDIIIGSTYIPNKLFKGVFKSLVQIALEDDGVISTFESVLLMNICEDREESFEELIKDYEDKISFDDLIDLFTELDDEIFELEFNL